MKKDIHPKYVECTVTCGCGETFKTRATKPAIAVEICSKCHPFYTGKQKFVDSAGQVEKFMKKFSWDEDKATKAKSAKGPKKVSRALIETPLLAVARDSDMASSPEGPGKKRRGDMDEDMDGAAPATAGKGAKAQKAPKEGAPAGAPAPAEAGKPSGEAKPGAAGPKPQKEPKQPKPAKEGAPAPAAGGKPAGEAKPPAEGKPSGEGKPAAAGPKPQKQPKPAKPGAAGAPPAPATPAEPPKA